MKKIKPLIIALSLFSYNIVFSQAFDQGTVAISANIGVPHLYKRIVKLATQSDKFKSAFNGKLEVSNFKGQNPISFKGEWGVNKYFGIGLSGSSWTMSFQVKDNYNILHAGQVTGTDEVDIYKFKLTSTSFGIRPNIHIPFESSKHDFFIGLGLGITSNKLNIDFTSTDVEKVLPGTKYDLSLPGFIYFAPSIGYKYYFSDYVGLNFEFGYEKGAILQGGIALRFNHKESE